MSSHDGPDPDAKTLHAVPSTNRLVDELCGAKLAPVLILLSIYIVTRGGGGERGVGHLPIKPEEGSRHRPPVEVLLISHPYHNPTQKRF